LLTDYRLALGSGYNNIIGLEGCRMIGMQDDGNVYGRMQDKNTSAGAVFVHLDRRDEG